uniref:GIY-YIG domain-containing protein n=1 Tax=Gongylonema pulchrum TaxID=637853 RepID=A0A183EPP6_9BILA
LIDIPSGDCTMRQFVDSIFYIGKGKRSRPLQHLVDAVRAKDFGESVVMKSKKLQRIVGLWAEGHGIVSLHVFQNTIPRGDYYGITKSWTMKEKTIYGSYLLSKVLAVFHVEGCREIYENDIRGS